MEEIVAFALGELFVVFSRGQGFAAVAADDLIEAQAGSVVAIGGGAGYAPQRRGAKESGAAAVILHLHEIGANFVAPEVAIDAAEDPRAGGDFAQLALEFFV